MTDATAVIIFAVISALVGFATALFTIRWSLKNLKMELRASYRSDLAKRQIEACEAFWAIFGPTSLTEGDHRIIKNLDSEPILDVQEADDFVSEFQDTFTSKAGLYLSKETILKSE